MSETVIGKSLTIDGEVTGDDALSIHGVVRGAISVSEAVYVSADGQVEATIDSLDVEIAGSVEGNVAAYRTPRRMFLTDTTLKEFLRECRGDDAPEQSASAAA